MDVDEADAAAYLAQTLGVDTDVTLIGEGALSKCFAFNMGHAEMVVRFGRYGDDFEKDRLASRYNAEWLPIPEVVQVGNAFGGFACISTRVPGTPLEDATEAEWVELAPSVVDIMEAIRTVRIPGPDTWGRWDPNGVAPHPTWRDFLLAVDDDSPTTRTPGWRSKLGEHPAGEEAFTWGYELLGSIDLSGVTRSLVHADLINRNVHVVTDEITGVFDWGASMYGDHLYELAWLHFWAPWHPTLDIKLLTESLDEEWDAVAHDVEQRDQRLLACHLHIALDHLAYHAHTGNPSELDNIIHRIRQLAV